MEKFAIVLFCIVCGFGRGQSASPILNSIACSSTSNACYRPFCYLTPINQTTTAVSFGCVDLGKPLKKVTIKQELKYRPFFNYIPLNIFPEIEFCSFQRKPDTSSYFYPVFVHLKKTVPEFIHRCPYEKQEFQMRNLIIAHEDISPLFKYVRGSYYISYTFYDETRKPIFNVNGYGKL